MAKKEEKSTGASKIDERFKAAQQAIDQIKEQFGDGSIMTFGEAKRMEVAAVSTGCLSLDIALGVGGVPRGRIIEVFGPEASGKTTLSQHIVAEVQKPAASRPLSTPNTLLTPSTPKKSGSISRIY